MTENKHTPGPWRVEEGTTVIWSDNAYDPGTNCVGCIVARAAQPSTWKGSRPTFDEQDANAHLIAKAWLIPELVEVLKRAVEAHGPFGNDSRPEWWPDACAAISKLEDQP